MSNTRPSLSGICIATKSYNVPCEVRSKLMTADNIKAYGISHSMRLGLSIMETWKNIFVKIFAVPTPCVQQVVIGLS